MSCPYAEPPPPPDQAHTEAQFSYTGHLQLDVLLSAMKPVTPHPDEHLFLTTHHVLELWFKHLIHDFKRVIAHLQTDELAQANWLLKRCAEVLRLAENHWTVLETMSAADFQEFRPYLTGASGMQSRQFREVEVMLGLCETADEAYCQRVKQAWPGMVEAYPVTLRQAFFGVFARNGMSLLDTYLNRRAHMELFQLAEHAIEIDRRFSSWRHSHILMVRRQIGMRTRGTGGTFGKDYLGSTSDYLFFPELWEMRHELSERAGGELAK